MSNCKDCILKDEMIEYLENKINEKSDFNYEMTCKYYNLKNKIALYIKGPLLNLIQRNNKVKF